MAGSWSAGTHTELLAAGGLYDELYRTQFAVQATGEAPAGEALREADRG